MAQPALHQLRYDKILIKYQIGEIIIQKYIKTMGLSVTHWKFRIVGKKSYCNMNLLLFQVAENGTGAIQATYYPDHLGHTLDDNSIQYMKLSLKEKEEIAGMKTVTLELHLTKV